MFRYSANQFNTLLLQLGCVRIGTLHDFRKSEHKRGIADPQEGKKRVTHHIKNLQISDASDPSIRKSKDARSLDEFRVMKLSNQKNITFNDVLVSREFDHPDCFVFCTSKFRSKKTMREFEGADTCVQITNINAFYNLLTKTINTITPVAFRGVHEVIYTEREEFWNGKDWGRHPALTKETEFEKQGEIRAIWEPLSNKKIEPIILGNYRLCSTCCKVTI